MIKPAIVTIGYNRPKAMARLLDSLSKASYPAGEDIKLIISIDKSDTDAVCEVADEFDWQYGEKIVVKRSENMGLKNHVLSCSGYALEYGSVIVLEDDLVVAPSFYEYSMKALDFSKKDERIGGISLYNHLFNVHARRSFSAVDDGFDNWYFQFASSWGQAYTKAQWEGFIKWFEENSEYDFSNPKVPKNVAGWSEKSWLKYYIAYLIETDKFFLYPRIGFTTNFGDVGSHAVKADTDLQIPMSFAKVPMYLSFSTLAQSRAVYDAFFENTGLDIELEDGKIIKSDDVTVDLYSLKPVEETIVDKTASTRYVLSSRTLPLKVIKTYGRQFRPLDANILLNSEGNDFYLYDVNTVEKVPVKHDEAEEFLYEYRGISAKQMMKMIKYRIKEKL